MTAAGTREWRIVAFLDHEDDLATMANPVHSTEFARELGFDGPLVRGQPSGAGASPPSWRRSAMAGSIMAGPVPLPPARLPRR